MSQGDYSRPIHEDVYGLDFPSEMFRVFKEKEERLYGDASAG